MITGRARLRRSTLASGFGSASIGRPRRSPATAWSAPSGPDPAARPPGYASPSVGVLRRSSGARGGARSGGRQPRRCARPGFAAFAVAHRSLDHVEGGWLVEPQHQPGDVGVGGQALPSRCLLEGREQQVVALARPSRLCWAPCIREEMTGRGSTRTRQSTIRPAIGRSPRTTGPRGSGGSVRPCG